MTVHLQEEKKGIKFEFRRKSLFFFKNSQMEKCTKTDTNNGLTVSPISGATEMFETRLCHSCGFGTTELVHFVHSPL